MKPIHVSSQVLQEVLRFVCEELGVNMSGSHLGREVSGFLIGYDAGDKIIINDYLSGDQESQPLYTTMTDDFLASLANKVSAGELKGGIYGWFHSHLGIGLFLSSRDIKTLKNMQRLNPEAFALVIDPLTKERFRFFRYDFESEKLHVEKIHIFQSPQ